MKDILKNSKFGDKFITRDNRIARFICVTELTNTINYYFYIEGEKVPMFFDEDGVCLMHNIDFDIISKYNK